MSVKCGKCDCGRTGRRIILGLAVVLFVVHQDQWYWTDSRLVWGIVPIGLAYHACYSVAAGLLWLLAAKFAWPYDLERFAEEKDERQSGKRGAGK